MRLTNQERVLHRQCTFIVHHTAVSDRSLRSASIFYRSETITVRELNGKRRFIWLVNVGVYRQYCCTAVVPQQALYFEQSFNEMRNNMPSVLNM